MLDGTIKCQKTLERLEEHDPSYLSKDDIPIAEDWDNAKVFVKFLKTFSEWKVNSSRFKIISQVARNIYSIPISTVPSESVFSTGGRVLDSFRSSLTPQMAKALICAQNWIQSKPLDDMTEEIDGTEEIDEEFINIGKEMEATFENLNNDSMV
ncbi:zinc finger BED domain-containing protein RICESLEEPER 2-like isoform X3 [Cucumis melo var. makuwa]|uniref:Zinc finger BED domain-containing protein RICESLEEPER 2-like isoform X3 n=1 Tax=Cucumis melo var. makuwa TaxID=1194695 RepID=A0A5A7V6W1_CUCMM|nr:zinc finger BED domain-containing protein RICESLEEPER 2-like isoform X3 [Cucumis melo var. makuwa]TYK08831.1 zinc finger BED domain-containing protein RICESLEEPER 2-like isoform X3 [Cucumis melo var. makuwa]